MENQLVIAIALYEEEKSKLEALIAECMNDFEGPDYGSAGYHQKALYHVHRTLRILKKMDDELYDKKQRKIDSIEWIKKQLEQSKSDFLKPWLKEKLINESKELEMLNASPKQQAPPGETLLDHSLMDLLNKKIPGFKLVYNKSKNLFLEFHATKHNIKIILPGIRQHMKHFILYDSDLKSLRDLGFVAVNNNKLVVTLLNQGEETLIKIRTILVKVVFDIFAYHKDNTQSFIQFA